MNSTTLHVGGDAFTWALFITVTTLMLLATFAVVVHLVRTACRKSGRTRLWALRSLAPLLVVAMAAVPYVSIIVHEPARSVSFDGRGVVFQYLWSRRVIPYAEVRSVRYEIRPYRRGSSVHEVAVTTMAGEYHGVRAKSYDPAAVTAVEAVYAQFKGRLSAEKLTSTATGP